ncbi:MAG: multicopper oxidase domain-containing protein [Planctomycetales bacterium]|nr:multicopper oxidase domain-containing protein [Planctomycetales bacterium]
MKSLVLAMANRADLVVDFAALCKDIKIGQPQQFVLVNTMPQKDGRGPKQKLVDGGDPRVLSLPFDVAGQDRPAELNRPIGLMKFVVYHPDDPEGPTYVDDVDCDSQPIVPINGSEAELAQLPTVLNAHHRNIEDSEVAVVREFIFKRGKGAWQINGRFYDPNLANATPCVGKAEEWVLRNGGGGWWHPIHIHLESHQLVTYEKDFLADGVIDDGLNPDVNPLRRRIPIQDNLPVPERIGLHDTQVLGPNTVARIRIRTRTFTGPFVFHCHNLEHEDMRMMFNFEPIAPASTGDGNSESCDPHVPLPWDPNLAPSARSHGNEVTWSDGVGELPWEFPPIPVTPVTDAGVDQIQRRKQQTRPTE